MEKVLLKIEEVLCPKPARGRGAGLEGFSGIWVVCPTSSKAFGQRKKDKKVLPETLNLLGPVLSKGFHFCNSLLGLL
jgi:hypothetical protein